MRPASMTAIRSDERQRFLAIMGDVDRGDADALLQRAQLVPQLQPHLVVEVRHRLVEQQQVRVDRQRAAERDALALAAGKLRHRPRPEAFELQQLQHVGDAVGDRGLRPAAHAQTIGDIVGDVHVRPQRIGLEHHRRLARFGRQTRDVLAADPDRARFRTHESGDRAQQRGLAAAGAAEQRDHLAALDAQADVIEHARRAVGDGQRFDRKIRRVCVQSVTAITPRPSAAGNALEYRGRVHRRLWRNCRWRSSCCTCSWNGSCIGLDDYDDRASVAPVERLIAR